MFNEVIGSNDYAAQSKCFYECRLSCRSSCNMFCYWEDPVFIAQTDDQIQMNRDLQIEY